MKNEIGAKIMSGFKSNPEVAQNMASPYVSSLHIPSDLPEQDEKSDELTPDLSYYDSSYLPEEKSFIGSYIVSDDSQSNTIEIINIIENEMVNKMFVDGARPFNIEIHKIKLPKSQIEIIGDVEGYKPFKYIKLPYWLYKKNEHVLKIQKLKGKGKKRFAPNSSNDRPEFIQKLQDKHIEDYFNMKYHEGQGRKNFESLKDKKNKEESREEFIVRLTTTESNTDETATSVFNNSRLFCNIAFPGFGGADDDTDLQLSHKEIVELGKSLTDLKNLTTGEYYDIGLKEYLKNNPPGKKTRQQIIEQGLQKFKRKLKGIDEEDVIKTVKHFSSKFAKVAEIIQLAEGPVFVYSNYVFYGVEAMAAVMESLGYSAFPRKGSSGSYFVWKGQADPDEIKRANKAFNSLANKDGSVLKIMFGTQSVMEGVDFKRVRQVHVLDPWWNDSRMQQVIARAIRLCSHRDLPPNKRVVNVLIHLTT
jgi:hypothetical protein